MRLFRDAGVIIDLTVDDSTLKYKQQIVNRYQLLL
jgi:hypothetical protein